jgi:membrane protein implicated in regulation of membrane protease activity
MIYAFAWLVLGLVLIGCHALFARPLLFLLGLAGVYTALFVTLGLDERFLQLGAFVAVAAAFYLVYRYLFASRLEERDEVQK